jgi:hypothetical protein
VEKKLPKGPVWIDPKEGFAEIMKHAMCKIELGVSW